MPGLIFFSEAKVSAPCFSDLFVLLTHFLIQFLMSSLWFVSKFTKMQDLVKLVNRYSIWITPIEQGPYVRPPHGPIFSLQRSLALARAVLQCTHLWPRLQSYMTRSKVTCTRNTHILEEEYRQDIPVAFHGSSSILPLWFYTTNEREVEHSPQSTNSHCYLLRKPAKNPF